jgi:antitoxin MazE
MKSVIKKWGNSAAIRLPAKILASAQIDINTEVEISPQKNCIIISPVKQKYDLDNLIKEITLNNCHDEIDSGEPTGKEIW